MKKILYILLFFVAFANVAIQAQDKIVNPDISYAANPRQYNIAGIEVDGIEGYEDYMLAGISGLSTGQEITIPGSEITMAVKKFWRHGLFSSVSIAADSIVGRDIYLHFYLTARPRVSEINYYGIKKSEREDMENKLGMLKDFQINPNMIDRARILAEKYFKDKGYNDVEINISQKDDISRKNYVILDVVIDKKQKKKVKKLTIEGVNQVKMSKITGTMFGKGAMGNIHEVNKFKNIFKKKKFTPERWKEDKKSIIEKYNEYGFRDAVIVEDSVWNQDEKHVNVYIKIDEGTRYYLRNITWVGNTVYTTDALSKILDMKKGDVYNQTLMNKRLKEDEDAAGNLYYNNGYVFAGLDPTEINITGDSIDIEIRVQEGPQARLNHVRINGNDRLYENVIRRELRTKPGDLFSKEALTRTIRELASMGHFDPEQITPDIKPDYENGTVDVTYNLVQKSNDQVEFSLGWGQTGIIGKVGLKLNNFSMANLFRKNAEHRGIMPIGDGEQLSISAQTNASYYQSYNVGYSTSWFGGKRPIQFSVGLFYSKQTDVSSSYYNSGYYSNYYNYYYGYGSTSGYNNYESYYDPDKCIRMIGANIGWGKRLRWPDDYFTVSVGLSYTRYMLKNWSYFLMTNGNANNINLSLAINRSSSDNQLFPRRGSEFSASVTVTPPWSLWDGKDYANLAKDPYSDNYSKEQQEKYRWIEYHKWKFKSRTYTALSSAPKCFVLSTRVEFGILGHFNKNKKSPFETYYVGGDGMSGYSSYATETIALRGYENGSLTPYGYEGYAYDRLSLELRFPFLLGNTTIYGLTFLEGGNAWTDIKDFNPFNLKRSAGVGVRIFLPMVGLMGIDWGYGFDKVYGSKGGSNFHFILGQEF